MLKLVLIQIDVMLNVFNDSLHSSCAALVGQLDRVLAATETVMQRAPPVIGGPWIQHAYRYTHEMRWTSRYKRQTIASKSTVASFMAVLDRLTKLRDEAAAIETQGHTVAFNHASIASLTAVSRALCSLTLNRAETCVVIGCSLSNSRKPSRVSPRKLNRHLGPCLLRSSRAHAPGSSVS